MNIHEFKGALQKYFKSNERLKDYDQDFLEGEHIFYTEYFNVMIYDCGKVDIVPSHSENHENSRSYTNLDRCLDFIENCALVVFKLNLR
jgi:hypothetical protein